MADIRWDEVVERCGGAREADMMLYNYAIHGIAGGGINSQQWDEIYALYWGPIRSLTGQLRELFKKSV
jgi:hypothetical protein